MLAVTDSGEGMDEATKAQMFEPFFTTKAAGKGTGLGLAMVYGIVKQNGGFIWVYSEPGQGTCFKIYLPVSAVDVPQEPEVGAGAHSEPAFTGHSILVVEDEQPIRLLVTEFLEMEGHRVVSAEGRTQALELVRTHPGGFDILLTDVILAEGTGRDLAKAVLAMGGRTRGIYMSGYPANAIVHHGVLENTIFLQKPFTRAGLLAKVKDCMAAPKRVS